MFVLGLQGSPRTGGNTHTLLTAFLAEAEKLGARTYELSVASQKITPCRECGTCNREGVCPVEDDMQEIYYLLRQADLIVMATPIFFYGPSAQLKILIDRSQALWSRRYVHHLIDPGRKWRIGFLLALGATKGEKLFEGVTLTARYFFDAVGARLIGSLTYRQIEGPGEIATHPNALQDAQTKAATLVKPFLTRKKVLFVGKKNACRSQMAGAFLQLQAGDRIETESGGIDPSPSMDKRMMTVMAEKGIDMAFRRPKSVDEVATYFQPDSVVGIESQAVGSWFPGVPREDWCLPRLSNRPIEAVRELRNEIEIRVGKLISD